MKSQLPERFLYCHGGSTTGTQTIVVRSPGGWVVTHLLLGVHGHAMVITDPNHLLHPESFRAWGENLVEEL